MRILGISCHYHDAAACIYGDDGVVAAAEEERFSRKKHDASFPVGSIRWLLGHTGLQADDLDHVVFYEKPLLKFGRVLEMTVDAFPTGIGHFVPAMGTWLREKLWVADRIRAMGWRGEILYGEHHLSHAASAYYPSPFDDAAVLTLDGVGERATTTIGRGSGLDLEIMEEIHFPHSLGLMYSVLTAFLGFEVNDGEYKVMGLAAFGRPRYVDQVRRLIAFSEDRSYRLDLRYFAYPRSPGAWTRALEEILGPPFAPGALEGAIDERAADIAASIQFVAEEAVLALASRARDLTGSRRLCFAGGVAQNVLANGRIVREGLFDEVYVPPAPGDSGAAVGAAAYLAHAILRQPRARGGGPFLGPAFTADEIRRAVTAAGLPHRQIERGEIAREAARMIANGKVIGWFQGRMEFGPRALGARSILADPRDPAMKEKVNALIKFREPFRPFAPAVVSTDLDQYFEDRPASPFMSFAVRVRPEARASIPAVTHVDGSSRIQTVGPDMDPLFYDLLEQMRLFTGHPIALNTSFNVRGEPIVATPADALDCFARTSLDALFIGDVIVERGAAVSSAPVPRSGSSVAIPVS